ncbi:MAG: hypothetical protein CL908_09085 [Deltaproteobacteria bacterium]|nr:hypothetical protein [Deltaproteobacteria bacterium]
MDGFVRPARGSHRRIADRSSGGRGRVGAKATFDKVVDALAGGKPLLDVRLRWENADQDGLQRSNAVTVRTRLGYQTKPIYGVSGLLEFENIASPLPSGYWDTIEGNDSRQTGVADSEVFAANRFWVNFEKPEWAGLKLKTGRQRIKLDDDRWVGNVGWRQNEQTYDSTRLQTDLGIDKLLAQYMYVWEVNRIFGEPSGSSSAGKRDRGQSTHFFNVAYQVADPLKVVGFIYLIDANRVNSSTPANDMGSYTYGMRVNGALPVSDELKLSYIASYAYQEDDANESNSLDYHAHYYNLETGLALEDIGSIGVGFEVLGTYNGEARVVTPFATGHKWNGFADAFLDNGGGRGLRDFYASVAPKIPCEGVSLKFIFHQFYDDKGGDNLGQEYDGVAGYKVNKHLSFLYKVAYYDGGKNRSKPSVVKNILQTTFKF